MKLPRFTIRRMMVVVAVVAMLLVSGRVGVAVTNEIKRRISLVSAQFYRGTTNAGVGVPPDR